MINPNICKLVTVDVLPEEPGRGLFAIYQGVKLTIVHGYKKPGKRRYYLKFSIFTDSYYLSTRA